MVKCACGCGQEIIIKKYHMEPSRSIPKYIHGHNGRVNKIISNKEKLEKIPCKCGCGEYINKYDKREKRRFYKKGHKIKLKIVRERFNESKKKKYFCACGCGQEIIIKKYHTQQSVNIPKYIHGHNGKGKGIKNIIQKLSKNVLYHNYIIEDKNGVVISKELNIPYTTIYKYLKKYNIPLKKDELEKKWIEEKSKKTRYCKCGCGERIKIISCHKYSGIPKYISGHNTFNNWSSFEPYSKEFNNKLKKFIINRDNFTCQLCFDKILRNTRKRLLTCHHIDYNKKNSNPNNLITLCNLCNLSVNMKREEWTKHFQNKINGRIK